MIAQTETVAYIQAYIQAYVQVCIPFVFTSATPLLDLKTLVAGTKRKTRDLIHSNTSVKMSTSVLQVTMTLAIPGIS
ncbi:hypothetical protein HYQ44_005429 [Verticillium longisporum]|nr:hypothetical protein HYQ44_005429 [Verticillium longisporum]